MRKPSIWALLHGNNAQGFEWMTQYNHYLSILKLNHFFYNIVLVIEQRIKLILTNTRRHLEVTVNQK